MSILNAWVTPSKATLATDTLFPRADGQRGVASKIMTLPHLPAAIALRGQAALFHLVSFRCAIGGFESFDDLVRFLSVNLRALELELPLSSLTKGYEQDGTKLVAIGWSDRYSAMVGRAFERYGDEQEFKEFEFNRYIAPSDGLSEGAALLESAAEKIARAQIQWFRTEWPQESEFFGGKLVMCHLTRKSISFRHHAEL